MKEIEDERFLDLDFFLGTFERADPPRLHKRGENPPDQARDEQPEKKRWPHD